MSPTLTPMKVRVALLNYTSTLPDGRKSNETAFRGAVIELEDRVEFNRLVELGAIVPVDQDLERPGRLYDLPETVMDEELINWVANASDREVTDLVAKRPELAARVSGLLTRLDDMRTGADALLGHKTRLEGLIADAQDDLPEFDHLGVPLRADPGTSAGVQGGTGGSAIVDEDGNPVTDETTEGTEIEPANFDFDALVRKNVKEVADFIADNPHVAAEVLAAETRHAQTTGSEPRQTVVRAVEAAAGHTQ